NTSSSPKLERRSDFVDFLMNDDDHALIWIIDLANGDRISWTLRFVAVLRGNLVAIQPIRSNSDSCGNRGDSRDSVHVYDLDGARAQYGRHMNLSAIVVTSAHQMFMFKS
ncbi:hypothetical protein TorRG33x02_231910, partial [Trema orientale]